jgi:hypothetical protein
MNFVEIIENERKPKLTGGRRGASTLQPGGTNVNNSLVPVNQLPPSAGSLANVMATLKPKMPNLKENKLKAVLEHPGNHPEVFNNILSVAKKTSGGKRGRPKKGGAMVANPDGTYTGVGSDDPNTWRRIGGAVYLDKDGHMKDTNSHIVSKKGGAYLGPDGKVHIPDFYKRKKGGAYLGPDGKVHHGTYGLGSTKGGKMSKLVPRHGHGANTQIGINYQLGQFGGAIQPIGNTASTLSPALSGMSVGAGRKCGGKRPKGKNLKKLIALMVKGRKHLHGDGFFDDAYKTIKDVAVGLYHEFGPQIFEGGKDILLEALEEGAKMYIGGGMRGGDFWGDVLGGLKAIGSWIWDTLKEVLNSEIVKEIEHEVLSMGVDMAKTYVIGKIASGAPAPTGAGFTPPDGMKPIGSDPRSYAPMPRKVGGDFGDEIKKVADCYNQFLGVLQHPLSVKEMNDFFNQTISQLNLKHFDDIKEKFLRAATEYWKGGSIRKVGGDFGDEIKKVADCYNQFLGVLQHPLSVKEMNDFFNQTISQLNLKHFDDIKEKFLRAATEYWKGGSIRKVGGDFWSDIIKNLDPKYAKLLKPIVPRNDIYKMKGGVLSHAQINKIVTGAGLKRNERKAVRKTGGDATSDYQDAAYEISQWWGNHEGDTPQQRIDYINTLRGKYPDALLQVFIDSADPYYHPQKPSYEEKGPGWRPDGYTGEGRKGKGSARGEIVKKIMKEKGLSLPLASKYVKEHGLY